MMKFSMATKVMSLTLAMLVSASVAMPGFNNSITVKAESSAKTITGLGTGTIGNPANGAGQWDYVYYGKYNDLNVKYRVLDTDCDDFSDYGNLSKNTVLLDCDNVLYHLRPGSAAKLLENLNDQGLLDAGVFTDAEKEAIALSRKERESTDDGEGVDGDFAQLKEMKIFALDPKEATNPTYGYKNQKDDLNRIKRNITTDEKENWWLRLGKDGRFQNIIAKEMYKTDKLIGRIKTEPADSSEGVSPAFNLKKESILFSSLVSGSSNEYKLTLIDDSMKSLKDVKCKKNDDEATISFKYPYETVDDSVSFSVVLLKDRYERGKTVDNSSEFAYIPITLSSEGQVGSGKNKYHMMSGTFKLPEQSSGLKFAYLIYEKNNGSKETDYACAPKFFELDSENHVHAWEIDYLGAGDDNATVRCKDCSEKYKISIVAASKQYGDDVSVTINKPDDLPGEIQVSDVIYRDGNGRDIDKSEVGEVGEYTAVAVISVVDENGDNQEVEIANNFKITPIVLLPSMVKLSEDRYVYDGTAKTPEVTVVVNGKELSRDEYEVEYKDNVNPGLATVKVYSKNPHYTDQVIKEFRIVNQSVEDKEKETKAKIEDKRQKVDETKNDIKNNETKSDKKENGVETKVKDKVNDAKKVADNTSGTSSKSEKNEIVQVNAATMHNAGEIINGLGDTYMVTSNDDTDLTVTFLKARSETISSITIPSTIVVDGNEYRVTEIAESAFSGNKKLKKVTIGDNVEKIGANAFYKCKKLKKIKIETTYLKKSNVGKNAFKKIHKEAKVTVPENKYKSYKKMLKSRGVSGENQQIKKASE